MIENKLEQIAIKENGNYSFNDYTVSFTDGSRSLDSEYILQFEYEDCKIEILIRIGHIELMNVTCILSTFIRPLDFEVTSISPFENLFYRKKSRFKVKCKNINFKHFLENKALLVFEEDIRTKNFNPTIFTNNEDKSKKVLIEFHLGFPDWIDVIEKVNQFLKTVIDELKSENRFISSTHYKKTKP